MRSWQIDLYTITRDLIDVCVGVDFFCFKIKLKSFQGFYKNKIKSTLKKIQLNLTQSTSPHTSSHDDNGKSQQKQQPAHTVWWWMMMKFNFGEKIISITCIYWKTESLIFKKVNK